jgi:hypothetical protein
MTAPASHYSIASEYSLTIRARGPSLTEAAVPPNGGLLAMDKRMTLPSYEYLDKCCGTRARALPPFAAASVVVRGADAGFTGWL